MATLTEEIIRNALCDCYAPQISLNIIELGLVEGVTLVEDFDAPGAGIAGVPIRYRVRILLLSMGEEDDSANQITAQVRNRLAGFFELSSIVVETTEEPAWTPARITARGRKVLGLDPSPFSILNNQARSF